jgi:hypothetical protein
MPGPTFVIAQNQNTMSWLEAMDEVAAVLGNSGDADQRAVALSCIKDTLRDLNVAREWSWMRNSTTGSVTTDGLITMPARGTKVYSLVVSNKTLNYMDKRDWLRQVDLTQNIGLTGYYDIYKTGNTNTIEVSDHPASSAPYTLYYHALMPIAYQTANAEVVDVPENVMSFVLAQAKADYIARVDSGSPKLDYYSAQAKFRRGRLIAEDTRQPDEDGGFTPGYLHAQPVNPVYDPNYLFW